MLDVDVAQDRDVVVERAAQSGELSGTALDEALVRDIGTDDHVAADEVRAYERGDGHCLQARVAQEVDPHRERGLAAHFADDDAHRGDGHSWHRLAEERRVAHVLDDEPIETGALKDRRLLERDLDDLVEAQLAARRAGQRRQVDHADERPAPKQLRRRHDGSLLIHPLNLHACPPPAFSRISSAASIGEGGVPGAPLVAAEPPCRR